MRRKPFVPFRLYTSSGVSYDVLHPEMIHITQGGATISIYDPGQNLEEIPARDAYCSFLHITHVEELRPRTASEQQ